MLKEQVTFLSSQVTELNCTVRFQECFIDRLLSTQEYISTALVQKTATTTKSSLCSESSRVVERVDLGLPQDADLEGWRDSLPRTLAEVPPCIVRYADETPDAPTMTAAPGIARRLEIWTTLQKTRKATVREAVIAIQKEDQIPQSVIRIVTIVLPCNQEETLLSTTPTWMK